MALKFYSDLHVLSTRMYKQPEFYTNKRAFQCIFSDF